MSHRTHWAGAALRPWQFPELDVPASQDQVSLPTESDLEIAAAEIDEFTAAPEERSTSENVAEQIASGYAEGFERGLSEGREKGYAEGLEVGTKAGKKSLSAEARRIWEVLSREEGFSAEEIAQTLVDQGILGRARGEALLPAVQLPPTIQGVLAARIDRLPAEPKSLLQVAAVIGKTCARDLLQSRWSRPGAGRARFGHGSLAN